MRASRSSVLSLAAALVLAGAAGQAQETRDVDAMVRQLEMPKVGYYYVGLSFSAGALTGGSADEQAGKDVDSLLAKGDLSAADWKYIAEASYAKGQVRFANLAADRAIKAYSLRVAEAPEEVDALVALGSLLALRGREAEAEPHLRKALEIDPARFDAYLAMSQVFLVQSCPALRAWGRACATEFVRAFPEQSAEMGYSAGNLPPLHVAVEWLYVVRPRGETLARVLAAARLAVGPLDHLTPLPQSLYGQWYSAAMGRIVTELSGARPAEALKTAMGMLAGLDGRVLLDLARQPADGPLASPDDLCTLMLFSALTPDFLAACQRACVAHPDDLGLRALVGSLQATVVMWDLMSDRSSEATAAAVDPTQAETAISNLRVALTLPPDKRADVTGNLATMYLLKGDVAGARGVADDAIARGEWDLATVSSALMALSGLDLRQVARAPTIIDTLAPERLREVESALAKWIASAPPSDAIPYGILAAARRRLGDFAGAADALRKAREFAPKSQLYACGLGVALLKSGQLEEAAKVLAEAVDLPQGPPDVQPILHRAYGIALLGVGRQAEGEAELKLAEGQ